MFYSMVMDDIATGAVVDAYKTIGSIIAADTAGHRFRVRSIDVTASDDTPPDSKCAVKLARIADVSAGTAGTAAATVSAANMAKKDPGSVNSLMTGKRDYSAEPTAYETEELWGGDFHAGGGGILKRFDGGDGEEIPTFTRDSLAGLLAAPRSATAIKLHCTVEFEVF